MSAESDNDQRLAASIRRHMFLVSVLAFFLVGGVGAWAALTEVAGAVVATGTVVVETSTKQVQHQEGGIVKEIRVQHGDMVKAGDLLIQLDDTVTRANLAVIIKQLDEFNAQKSRLLAEQSGRDKINFTDRTSDNEQRQSIMIIEENQRRLMQARRNSLNGRKAQLKEQVTQLEQQILGLIVQRDAKKKEIGFVIGELADLERLFEKKFVSTARITELKRDKAQLQGEHGGIVAEIAQARVAISERNMQILQVGEESRVEVLQHLQDTRLSIAKLEEQRIEAEDQLTRAEIRAPRSGYVHNLSVHTIGGVIAPAETVMLIVPREDLLLIEAEIQPVDIDQLSPNQEARIRLPSFDQRSTPELKANLKTISADLLQDQVSGIKYYQARLTIPKHELVKLNGKSLIPGMPVEVFIKTEDRTVLSYLVKPIVDQIAHALKER